MNNNIFNITFLGIELFVLGTLVEDGRNHTILQDTLNQKEMITLEVFSRNGFAHRTYRVTIGSKEHLIYRCAGSDLSKLEVEAAQAIKEEKEKIKNFIDFVQEHKF